ncbi:hypothetical protein Tco_1032243 [Tanacetum coccineum]|uniref:Reverse transcriptase domain-containing protein n=1 Tax=Tanacetum coccineum TaxID=301880 RepID=A0ABQ5GDE7_9ASTR
MTRFMCQILKKCLADANLHVSLDEIKVDKTLRFVEEPLEIMDHEVKTLKHSMIPVVKVRWNSKRGPEFTGEREDHMKAKFFARLIEEFGFALHRGSKPTYLTTVDTKLFTHDIRRTKTYKDYENELNNEFDEPWSKNGVPYEICDHICEAFCFKNRETKWPTCNSNEDGFCNGRDLPGMVRVGYMTYFQDYEWYDDLTDNSLKEEALKQKAIYEKDHIRGPYVNINTPYAPYLDSRNGKTSNNSDIQKEDELYKNKERCELFDNPRQEPPVCKIRRFVMITYSFGQEEEYVAVKEYEYDDLCRTNEDACHAYQEIFHSMDEGWLVTRAE